MPTAVWIAQALFAGWVAFWIWYGGNGQPMALAERDALLSALQATDTSAQGEASLAEVRELMASDDGKEFVMQNLVRYRPKALYPAGYHYSDDPRAADKRYAKAIWWNLLRYGNLILMVAPRSGNFVVPEGADAWHYVALVRYRSRKDFLRFAIASNKADTFVHKWAAIEKTHIFPVRPIVSLFMVRSLVALALFCAWLLLARVLAAGSMA
ncbi:MAG: hypothetical protein CFE43_00325 [Burkholderiales bacterium PBB3]|nr:MAG: hypothetical protein CFE43_00325 [Burkholderiales bacterium PBB3]